MQVTLDIPDDLVSSLRQAHGQDLSRAARESLALEGYRSGKLTHAEVQRIVGLADRWATEEWLASKQAMLNYTIDDLEADGQTLDRLVGPVKP